MADSERRVADSFVCYSAESRLQRDYVVVHREIVLNNHVELVDKHTVRSAADNVPAFVEQLDVAESTGQLKRVVVSERLDTPDSCGAVETCGNDKVVGELVD